MSSLMFASAQVFRPRPEAILTADNLDMALWSVTTKRVVMLKTHLGFGLGLVNDNV